MNAVLHSKKDNQKSNYKKYNLLFINVLHQYFECNFLPGKILRKYKT